MHPVHDPRGDRGPGAAAAGPRVLIVDGEALVRWSLSAHLTRAGYQVAAAAAGEHALVKLAQVRPEIVLLDHQLPGVGGLEVLDRAVRDLPGVAVIVMSSPGTIAVALGAMQRGAADFLVKPFTFQALDESIGRARASLGLGREGREAAATCRRLEVTVVGESAAVRELRRAIARLASGDRPVLIDGERGVGKTVVARALHREGPRAAGPLVEVSCVRSPGEGAVRPGRIEAPGEGTLVLDEVGALVRGRQAQVLRLLERGDRERGDRERGDRERGDGGRSDGVAQPRVAARLVATTSANLEKEVAEGRFRGDLFFRLNAARIHVPPLRRRPEDIAPLAAHFLARATCEGAAPAPAIAPATLEVLVAHAWPGNVRELRDVIELAVARHDGLDELQPEHLPRELRSP